MSTAEKTEIANITQLKNQTSILKQSEALSESDQKFREVHGMLKYLFIELHARDRFFQPAEYEFTHFARRYLKLYGLHICRRVFIQYEEGRLDLSTYKTMSFTIFGDICRAEFLRSRQETETKNRLDDLYNSSRNEELGKSALKELKDFIEKVKT